MERHIKISLVVAMGHNGVIGNRGGLPWKIAADMKRFRRLTLGKPIIMGRKTHEAIGHKLDERFNIVLTHRSLLTPGVLVARAIDEALDMAGSVRERWGDEVMVIGGAQVYRAFAPLADLIHITLVDGEFEGDAFFDVGIWSPKWRSVYKGSTPADKANSHAAAYYCFVRRSNG